MLFNNKPQGFTIVELLVVIVIIGILSTLALLSFSGISQKAVVSSVKFDLAQSSTSLNLYRVEHSSYPTSINASGCPLLPVVDSKYCIKPSEGNLINYYSGTQNTFILYIKNGNTTYKVSENSKPEELAPTIETVNGTAFIANNAFIANYPSWGGDYDDDSWDEYNYEQSSLFDLSPYSAGIISNASVSWNYATMYGSTGTGCNRYLDFDTTRIWTGNCVSTVSSVSTQTLTDLVNSSKGTSKTVYWRSDAGNPDYDYWGYQGNMSNPRLTFTWTR